MGNGNGIVNSRASGDSRAMTEMYLQRKEYENMTNGKNGSKSPSCEVGVSGGGAEVSELYCEGLSKESVVQGDVRKGVKGSVRAEVRGVRNARQNRVSPDIYPPFKGVAA